MSLFHNLCLGLLFYSSVRISIFVQPCARHCLSSFVRKICLPYGRQIISHDLKTRIYQYAIQELTVSNI